MSIRGFPGKLGILLTRLWEPALTVPLLVALSVRLILLPWFSDPYNFWGTHLATDLLVTGWDPFIVLTNDPRFGQLNPWGYPGLYFAFTVPAYLVSGEDAYVYGVLLKIPFAFLDLGTGILLFRIARLVGGGQAISRIVTLAFLFNPFSVLITSVWGTNDPLPIFLTTLALFFLLRGREGDEYRTGWALGLGIAAKLYPILLLPVALATMQRVGKGLRLLALAGLIPVLTSAPFLVTGAGSYFRVLFGFASGSEEGILDPHFTPLQAVEYIAGPLPAELALVMAAVLILALLGTYRAVRRGRMDILSASLLVLLLASLLAVRWAQSYMLWMVPFATAFAFLRLSGWRRWLVLLFWVPSVAHALIYNGWYPDAFSGASGFHYWGLVSGWPPVQVFALFPAETFALLLLSSGAMGISAAYQAFRSGRHLPPDDFQQERHAPPRASLEGKAQVLSVALLGFAILAASLSTGYLASSRSPITPTDFGTFRVVSGETVSFKDAFEANILSFRWVFGGTGSYTLRPGGSPGILLDTIRPGGLAFLTQSLQTENLSVDLTFEVIDRYGLGPLLLLVLPGGWVGVRYNETKESEEMVFFDLDRDIALYLGEIEAGVQRLVVTVSPDERRFETTGGMFIAQGNGEAIAEFTLGHAFVEAGGGGAFHVSEVALQWSPPQDAVAGPPVVGVLSLAVLSVVLGLVPWQSPRVLGGRVQNRKPR